MLATLIIIALCIYNAYIGVKGGRAVRMYNDLYADNKKLHEYNLKLQQDVRDHEYFARISMQTMHGLVGPTVMAQYTSLMQKEILRGRP